MNPSTFFRVLTDIPLSSWSKRKTFATISSTNVLLTQLTRFGYKDKQILVNAFSVTNNFKVILSCAIRKINHSLILPVVRDCEFYFDWSLTLLVERMTSVNGCTTWQGYRKVHLSATAELSNHSHLHTLFSTVAFFDMLRIAYQDETESKRY